MSRPIEWDAYAGILGADTDGGVARRVGCSVGAVVLDGVEGV